MTEREIEEKANDMATQATALVVVDAASYSMANNYGAAATALLKAIDEAFDPIIEQAHKAHKTAIAQKKKQSAPVQAIKDQIDRKMVEWYKLERARIEEARRKDEEAARKKAEDAALAEAEILQSMGMTEAAEDAISAPLVYEAVKPQAQEKADGVSYREFYHAEVVELIALVKAVASGEAPIAYLEANMVALNGVARTQKQAALIPGVKVVVEVVQVRR